MTVAFAGDPIPEDERTRLVPIEAEASVEEDLLEDSARAIEQYFRERGYRDAVASYTRDQRDSEQTIRFVVSRSTVKFHVSSILSKLNLQRRTQAAAFVARHHLGEPPSGNCSC